MILYGDVFAVETAVANRNVVLTWLAESTRCLANNKLLTMLTVLMTPIKLKEIKVSISGEPEGQRLASTTPPFHHRGSEQRYQRC